MSKRRGFVLMALQGLFGKDRPLRFSMDVKSIVPKEEKPNKMSKQKLGKLKGKKARKNRGKNRSKK